MKPPPLFSIKDLRKSFDPVRGAVLDGVDLTILGGETVALVGRSGAGKSTLARCVAGLESPESGEIFIDGSPFNPRERTLRRLVQMVWQDPVPSLSPYRSVAASIREPLDAFSIAPPSSRENRVQELMRYVGLAPELASPGRISCPEASASASSSPGLWRRTRVSSSLTNHCRRSTRPLKPTSFRFS